MKEHNTIIRVGQLVARYRERHNMSQEKLAEVLDLHVNQIARLERGEVDFRVSTLIALLRNENKLTELITILESLQNK